MANETELGNYSTVTDVLSDALGPAVVESVVVTPLIYTETAPADTNVKEFRKAGSLVATDKAESAVHSYGANDEYTESSVTATLTKSVSYMKLTVEADRFAPNALQKGTAAAGNALARRLDDKCLALFDDFSNAITADSGTTLTVDSLLDAAYTVFSGNLGGARTLVGVVDFKGANEIKKEVNSSAAAAYSQPQQSSLLQGPFATGTGFIGSIPGIDLYATSGLPTDSGDDVALVFNPDLAIAGMIDGSVSVRSVWNATGGMFDEYAAFIFNTFIEWYDGAGCGVKSAT